MVLQMVQLRSYQDMKVGLLKVSNSEKLQIEFYPMLLEVADGLMAPQGVAVHLRLSEIKFMSNSELPAPILDILELRGPDFLRVMIPDVEAANVAIQHYKLMIRTE